MINLIKDILKIKYKKGNDLSLYQNIINSYISFDNEKVVFMIKRLYLIYLKHIRMLKLIMIQKWRVHSIKVKLFIEKLKEISTNKKKLSRCNSAVQHHSSYLSSKEDNDTIMITKPNEFSILPTSTENRSKRKQSPSIRKEYSSYNHIPMNLERRYKLKEELVKNGFLHKAEKKKNTKNQSRLARYERERYINELYKSNMMKEEKIKQMKLEKEQEFSATYTFKPILESKKIKRNNSTLSTPFLERLKQYEQSKKSNLNHLRKEIESERPKPRSASKRDHSTIMIPMTDNYFDSKKQKINEIRKEMESEQGITFKPKLNDNQNKKVKDTVTKRNEQFLREKEEKLLNNSFYSNTEKECTFTPQLNRTQSRINKTFDERLTEYQSIQETHKEEIRLKYERNYPFMPEISPNTGLILNNKKFIMEQMKKKNEDINDDNEENLVNIKSEKNEAFCSHSQEIQEISDEETNSIANYESKELRSTEKKNNKSVKTSVTGSKLKYSSVSISDEKAFELAKTKMSVDESLEKFQMKYNGIMKKNETSNKIKNLKKSEQRPKGTILNRLEYYDNLDN